MYMVGHRDVAASHRLKEQYRQPTSSLLKYPQMKTQTPIRSWSSQTDLKTPVLPEESFYKLQHHIRVIAVFPTKLSFRMCRPLPATHKLNQERFTAEPLAQNQQKEQKMSQSWKGFWNTQRILKHGANSEASAAEIWAILRKEALFIEQGSNKGGNKNNHPPTPPQKRMWSRLHQI